MLNLTKKPIDAIEYQGKKYSVDLAFDTVLNFLNLTSDDSIDSDVKVRQTIVLFFGKPGELYPTVYAKLPQDKAFFTKFFDLLKRIINESPYGFKDSNGNQMTNADTVQYYSFKKDAGAIYASFLQQYQIDLIDQQGKLHWDKFKALLDGLDDKTQLMKLVDLRKKNPGDPDIDPKDRQKLIDAQTYYTVNEPVSDAKSEAKVFNQSALTSMFNSLLAQAKKGGG